MQFSIAGSRPASLDVDVTGVGGVYPSLGDDTGANLLPSPSLSSSRSGGDLYESEASTALLGGSVRGSTNLSRNKVVATD